MAFLVNRARANPLHDQIRRAIWAQISSGELTPGERLPTEHEYAVQFNVSLAPVRQALLDLVAAGHLVRIKGKGTFVAEGRVDTPITLLASFTESLREQRIPFEMQVLEQCVGSAAPSEAQALGLRPPAGVVRLKRLAVVKGQPAAILDAALPAQRFAALAGIAGFEASRSLYATLEADFGVRVASAHSNLGVVRCDDDQAELLGVAVGTPALMVDSVTHDADGLPVEVARVLYRGDLFSFRIESQRS